MRTEDTKVELAILYSPATVLFAWGVMWMLGCSGRPFNIIMIFLLAIAVATAETYRIKRRYRRARNDRRRHGLVH